MPHKVDVSPDVGIALASALDYLDNVLFEPSAGDRLFAAYEAFLDIVEEFPEAFPLCDEFKLRKMGYRKALLESYVALYKYEDRVVKLVFLFHQSQDYAKLV